MDKTQILAELKPSWWAEMTDAWYNNQVGTQINFTNPSGVALTYLSNAPYQSNGLFAEPSGIDITVLVDDLMTQAAQSLENMHCASITGHTPLTSVYGGQA
jgi:hypothetical protein